MVVIGSGAGGGVAAATFARAGKRVVVLEAAGAFGAADFTQRETSIPNLYLEGGLASSQDLGLIVLAGAALGGGTTINWSTSLRLPPQIAVGMGDRKRHRRACGQARAALRRARSRVASSSPASATTRTTPFSSQGAAHSACTRRPCRATRQPTAAEGCGYCGMGCAYDKKGSTLKRFLARGRCEGRRDLRGARASNAFFSRGSEPSALRRCNAMRAAPRRHFPRTRPNDRLRCRLAAHAGLARAQRDRASVPRETALRASRFRDCGGFRSAHRRLERSDSNGLLRCLQLPQRKLRMQNRVGAGPSRVCGDGAALDERRSSRAHDGRVEPFGVAHRADARPGSRAASTSTTRPRSTTTRAIRRGERPRRTRRSDRRRFRRGRDQGAYASRRADRTRRRRSGIRSVVRRSWRSFTRSASLRIVSRSSARIRWERPRWEAIRSRRSSMPAVAYGASRTCSSPTRHSFPQSSGVNPMLTIMALARRVATLALEPAEALAGG